MRREVLTFMPGTVAWPGHFHLLDTDRQLRRAARLIREIIAHHDLAPWNLVIGDRQWAFVWAVKGRRR